MLPEAAVLPYLNKKSNRLSQVRGACDIYIIYTPNLGFGITVSVREREQGRFRGSSKGARGSTEGVKGSIEGARGSTMGQYRGAAGRSLK